MSIDAHFQLHYPSFELSVDLALPGEGVSALFGRSGSGKTTLLRCIAGLERAAGHLRVNGEVWQQGRRLLPTHERPIGYVFQEASLFGHLSVRENLNYGYRRIPAAARHVRFDETVALLGIGEFLDRPALQLSGGQRQRVAIGRALLTSPRLLLMDEPLASLDLQAKSEILPYLERLRTQLDIPVLYVSHSPDEVSRLADHLVLLEAGRVRASGPLDELLTRPDLPLAHALDAGAVLTAEVKAHDPGYQLTQLAVPGGDLFLSGAALEPGRKTRVRVLARDVSLALSPPSDSSILNILSAHVVDVGEDTDPAQALVRLDLEGSMLLARITRRSAEHLQLRPGLAVYAQVKSVALSQ
jgi:molybdate transport system ATP-binding protein